MRKFFKKEISDKKDSKKGVIKSIAQNAKRRKGNEEAKEKYSKFKKKTGSDRDNDFDGQTSSGRASFRREERPDRRSSSRDTERPNRFSDDRPYKSNDRFSKKSEGFDRPNKRSTDRSDDRPRSYSKRNDDDGSRFGKRGGDEPRRYSDRNDNNERPFRRSGDDERSSNRYSDKREGDKRSYNRSGSDERTPRRYSDRNAGNDRPFSRSSSGDRSPRKYSDGNDSDKRSYNKRGEGDERAPRRYSDRNEGNDRSFNRSGGDSRRFSDRNDSDKRPYRRSEGEDKRPKSFEKREGFGSRFLNRSDDNRINFDKKYKSRDDDWSNDAEDSRPPRRSSASRFEQNEPRERRDSKRESNSSDRFEKPAYKKTGERPRTRKSSTSSKSPSKVNDGKIRLNKYLSNSGVASRRDADDLIKSGAVTVNGQVITEMGYKINPEDVVVFGGDKIKNERKVYVLLNKPKDYITTMDDEKGRRTVMELLDGVKEHVFPVGRLDRNTTGLLLFTNDGELTNMLTHPKFGIKKIYSVELSKNLKPDDYRLIQSGVELEDGEIKVDSIAFIGDSRKEIGIEIHSGRNRIVRRIFESLGYDVLKLDRVGFAGLTKKDLPRAKYRYLDEKEVAYLKMLSNKS
jgi:23S rRNA pseudouridine2605 synthase